MLFALSLSAAVLPFRGACGVLFFTLASSVHTQLEDTKSKWRGSIMTFITFSVFAFYNSVPHKKLFLLLSELRETAVICKLSIPMVSSNRNQESHSVVESPEGLILLGLFTLI